MHIVHGIPNHALRQLASLTAARLREFVREKEALLWGFLIPLFISGALGLAFRDATERQTKVVLVGDAARVGALMTALERTPGLRPEALGLSDAEARLRTGKAALVVLTHGDQTLEYRYNPNLPDALNARLRVDDVVQRAAGRADLVTVQDRSEVQRGSRYIDFLIPGLLGMSLMSSCISGVAFTVVDMRRKQLLKLLMVTPMSRAHFLASFLLSRLCLLPIEAGVLLGLGILVFDLPVRSSWFSVFGLLSLATVAFCGMGLLVAARVRTGEAVSGLVNLVMVPMLMFSGVFFSAENYPAALRAVVQLLPLSAVNDALRSLLLQGASTSNILPQLAVIAAWALACHWLALRTFSWR